MAKLRVSEQLFRHRFAGFMENAACITITGVPTVDTQIASGLIRAAKAVQLLGAEVVLSGIRPEVARMLVQLGADLSEITTRNSLQSGIAYAMTRR